MKIQLSDHFTYGRLIRFTLPSIGMMIFTSIYSVVDGFFVSNFVGKTPFAAVNLIMPLLMIFGAVGFMMGAGGNAIVGKTLGEGDVPRANRYFSLFIYVTGAVGALFALIGIVFMRPLAGMLGAEGEILSYCVVYGRIILCALPFFMLQNMFQSFLIVAEKPNLGLAITVIAGATNMVLDALFMIVFKWGVAGAALATAASQFIGGFIPVVYFARKDSSTLKLVKARFDGRALFQASTNGSSEFVSNISMSIVAVLYNFQLMKYAGENGVAPIIGYNQGAENHIELQNVFKKSMVFNTVAGIALTTVAVVLAAPLSKIFVGYDAELLEMTTHAFKLYAISFLFTGFGIFGSSLFTALNNGLVSAIISFLRTLVFQVVTILILPSIWGIEGIWYSIIVAEFLGAAVAIVYILKYKKKYRY